MSIVMIYANSLWDKFMPSNLFAEYLVKGDTHCSLYMCHCCTEGGDFSASNGKPTVTPSL